MASKLKKAVKANCVARDDADGPGFLAGTGWPKQWPGQEPCYIVPAAEYERLIKADNLAAQLMEHESCVAECDKCKERRKISDQLARVNSNRWRSSHEPDMPGVRQRYLRDERRAPLPRLCDVLHATEIEQACGRD